MIKSLTEIEIQGNCLNFIKSIYKKPAANIVPNDERLNVSPEDQGKGKDICSDHSYQLSD